jgi:hypothetical protein
VVSFSEQRIIIAGDSRAAIIWNGTENARSLDDNTCKITPTDGNAVFAATGFEGTPGDDWSTYSEAQRAVAGTPHGTWMDTMTGGTALDHWATYLVRDIDGSFTPSQLSSITSATNGNMAFGILAGMNRAGRAWVDIARIDYQDGSLVPRVGEFERRAPTSYAAFGKTDVFHEFFDGKSKRALAERASWNRMKAASPSYDRFKTRRLVELTIKYERSNLVGGPIDEIEIDGSGIHWLQVKPACAAGIESRQQRVAR